MADSKITALTAISTVDPTADPLVIVDVSDTSMAASGTTKKATINQLLGASGTATLASATITGDLTVDTSTLKVDSANNRVGVVQSTPLYPLDVTGTVNGTAVAARLAYGVGGSVYSAFRFENTSFSGGNSEIRNYVNGATGTGSDLAFFTTQTGGSTLTERYRFDINGVHTWSNVGGGSGTAMTLNSTGLGVGTSPSHKLDVGGGTGNVFIRQNGSSTSGQGGGIFLARAGTEIGGIYHGSWATSGVGPVNSVFVGTSTAEVLLLGTNYTERMRIDTSGNVGIGIVPSYKLDVSTGGVLGTTARLFGNDQSNVRLRFENTGASGRIWELVGGLSGSNNRWFSLRDVTGSTTPWGVDDSMNVISNVTGTAPTLLANSQMVFNLTSNTNLRISVRGTDGTTRTADITLA